MTVTETVLSFKSIESSKGYLYVHRLPAVCHHFKVQELGLLFGGRFRIMSSEQ